jgi:hypothetical protein
MDDAQAQVGSLDCWIGVNHEEVKAMLEACLGKTGARAEIL